MYSKPTYSHDLDLTIYARRELGGTVAVLVGRHDANSILLEAASTPVGRARRVGRWVHHGLASLIALN